MGITRWCLIAALMIGLVGVGRSAFATPRQPVSVHVRAGNAPIATLIRQASERSHTFRSLLDTINASDSIVYIEPGRCGMRACFVNVTKAGSHRMLWVMLNLRGVDCDLMGLIGHELQHTVEVLADPRVTNATAMHFFYSQMADERSDGRVFETIAATKAGEAVRDEVRQTGRCTNLR